MKLLTHNMLTSKCLKGITNGFPLKIVVSFVIKIILKINFNLILILRQMKSKKWALSSTKTSSKGLYPKWIGMCYAVPPLRYQRLDPNTWSQHLIPLLIHNLMAFFMSVWGPIADNFEPEWDKRRSVETYTSRAPRDWDNRRTSGLSRKWP